MGKTRSWISAVALLPLVLIALAASIAGALVAPLSTSAAASIAMTGSFYSQDFMIPAGSGVSGSSIYVKVSNTGTQQLEIRMRYEAVEGVIIHLSREVFVLAPTEQQEVQVSVDVPNTALAGVYPDSLKVIAEAYEEGDGGSVSASAAEVASLTIMNESADVTVNTVGPSGQPVVAQIRLFRMVGDKGYEVAYSYTGSLQARVVPGTFTAEAYSLSTAEPLCDPERFDVAADESKTVALTVRMVYFEDDFVVSPVRDEKTKKMVSARTMATLTNVYEVLAGAQVKLSVTFNGDPLEEVTVLGPLPLPLNQTPVPWNYVPEQGWKEGLYGFKYQLYAGGLVTAETNEQTLKVGGGGIASWLWIIFVILGVLGAAALGTLIFILVRRRKKEEEKPRKVEKKGIEEKPAPKAKEPVRPVQPVRPPPAPMEEPIVEPAPLASISSLKARMASLGRDQGTGEPGEEEPEAEEQENSEQTSPQDGAEDVASPPLEMEPERPAVTKAQKPAGQKPGIFSRVTATPKVEPPAAAKHDTDVQINWPPKSVEPPRPPEPESDVQISWPPRPVEVPARSEPPMAGGFAEAARQRMQGTSPAAPEEAGEAEEAAGEEPIETEAPPSRSSFAEAARLRMEARQRANEAGEPGAESEEPQTEGDAGGEPGDGEERPSSS